MFFILYFFFGKRKIRITSLGAENIINYILRGKVNAKNIKKINERTVEFTILRGEYERLCAALGSSGAEIEILSNTGIPAVYARYKKRYGIAVGMLLFAAIIFLSTQFVWRIEVTGNENVSRSQIINVLQKVGVGEGSYIPSIDIIYSQQKAITEDNRIAWISLNRIGTVITAEVKESLLQEENENTPANIIATHDAQIESIEVFDGSAVVNVGDTVRTGELLISGIVEGNASGLRQIRAGGRVLARVSEQIHVEIPYEYEQKVSTGRSESKKNLIFFGKSINLFINSGISVSMYDKISSRRNITLFDTIKLPVYIDSETYEEYEICSGERSESEAAEAAYEELKLRVSEAIGSGELLSRRTSAGFTDTGYVIDCELYILKDIAQILPISTG